MEQAKFTALRDVRIVSEDFQHIAVFQKGQTRALVKPLHKPAIEAGLVPDTEDLSKLLASDEDAPKQPAYKDEPDKQRQLVEAAKEIIGTGDTSHFTTTGKLRAASVKALVDFEFTSKEAQEAYEQALFEEGQVGDQNQEHP